MLVVHARCLLESLGRLHRRWLATTLTSLVIALALALPTGLSLLVSNLDALAGRWHRAVEIALYLEPDVSSANGQALARRLIARDDVADTRFISAREGLADFRRASGLGGALDALPANPLPGVIMVRPDEHLSPAAIGALVDTLGERRGVEHARLDQAWLRRLAAILALLRRSAWVIGTLLAVAVVFIVGNTIRLDIENRREEIEVMKLIGASDAFIRRPFLYTGAWYGVFGGLLALFVLGICSRTLAAPLASLTRSYGGALELHGLDYSSAFLTLFAGVALGLAGSALTVNRRLAAIEPR